MIEPSSSFVLFYNFSRLVVILLLCYIVPLQLIFKVSVLVQITDLIYFVIIFLIFDLVLNFNIAIYKNGVLQKSRYQISTEYIYSQFFCDMICIFGFFAALANENLMVLIVIKFFQVPKYYQLIDNVMQIKQRHSTLNEIIQLLFIIVFTAHFCACGFYAVSSDLSDANRYNWIKKANLHNERQETKYINALYYSYISMMTIGYGDITPANDQEKLYCIILTMITCSIFAYAINTVGTIFREIQIKWSQTK